MSEQNQKDDGKSRHSLPNTTSSQSSNGRATTTFDRTQQNNGFDRTTQELPTRPTVEQYQDLEVAFDFFNHELFKNKLGLTLPHVMFTQPKDKRMMGYFQPHLWASKNGAKTASSEIALNPQYFTSPQAICQTLVHEMVHHAQAEFPDVLGKPGKRGYHNKAFANTMSRVGLMASSTGLPGGNKTGVIMSDYVIEGGAFEHALLAFTARGLDIRWSSGDQRNATSTDQAGNSLATPEDPEKLRKRRSKTKYSCPLCSTNMYGKPGIKASCLPCDSPFKEHTQ